MSLLVSNNEENKNSNPEENKPKTPDSIQNLVSTASGKLIENEIKKALESTLSKAKGTAQPKKIVIDREAEKAAVVIKAVASRYSGPIPPPLIFEGYKNVDPSFPERIMSDYEKRSEHARTMDLKAVDIEKQAISDDKLNVRLGMFAAFLIAFSFLGVGAYAAMHGKEQFGTTVVSVTLVSIVGSFLYDRKTKQK